jgi:UDP-N-acetylmuramate dehydrogenase
MKIIQGKSLAELTTFRIGGNARFFCSVQNVADIAKAVAFAKEKSLPIFILGGGSNLLVSDSDFEGLVIKLDIKGINELPNGCIQVGAGENWDEFVAWTVEHGFGGLENLSLIPGSVGAAPVQNIGAYGVEVGSFIESIEVFELPSGRIKTFSKHDCRFAYRDSIFKHKKGEYVILSVTFNLSKSAKPDISYKDLKEFFEKKNAGASKILPDIKAVRDAVIAIRTAKLPDVKKVGTAGSFFKNPVISAGEFTCLKEKYPELPGYPEADGRVKIPIAWVIDKVCGLKGRRWGDAGIHDTQALVIVNYGHATSTEIENVTREVEKTVQEKIGIKIEREVVMVGF